MLLPTKAPNTDKKDMLVPLSGDGLVFVKIELILVHQGTNVYFVLTKLKAEYLVDMGLYHIENRTLGDKAFQCIIADGLADYYPLPVYKMCGLSVVSLHHSVCQVNQNDDG